MNEQNQTEKKPKLKIKPLNEYLICEEVVIDEKIGSIILTDSIVRLGRIIRLADKMIPYVNDFEEGDVVAFPKGAPVFDLWFDDIKYIMIKKSDTFFIDERY